MRATMISLLMASAMLAGCAGSSSQKEEPEQAAGSGRPATLVTPEPLTNAQQQQLDNAQEQGNQGHWNRAEQILAMLATERPDVAHIASRLAWAMQQQGREDEARVMYRKALEANPGDLMAINNLALLLRASGNFEASRDLLRQGLQMNDSAPELHYNLAVLSELYLLELDAALTHYRAYQESLADQDQKVIGWIADLERRLQ